MSDTKIDLARRAVASKHWRWLPGMKDTSVSRRVYAADGPRAPNGGPRILDVIYEACGSVDRLPVETLLPDLADPCTLGGLLSLVRDAWGDPEMSVQGGEHCGWSVCEGSDRCSGRNIICPAGSEAEALVAALELAESDIQESPPEHLAPYMADGPPDLTEEEIEYGRELAAKIKTDAAAEFERLRAKWHEETMVTSSSTDLVLNPNYQRIIGLGPAVVPHILASLKVEPDHWGWALRAITGEDPVPVGCDGDIVAIADAWIAWGETNPT